MSQTCPTCGTPIPADAPGGLCPKCLLAGGLKDSNQTSDYVPYQPPGVAEIAALFPNLEIIELLGAGGMGAVYKARQPGLDRLVALKVLPRRDDPAFAERFTREARALAKLSYPGIVTVFDFGHVSGLYYFVMEFVDGVNLRQAERANTLKPAEALAIVPQICTALQFAHDAGVVHRDIKPENILLDKQGRVKIADFGLAKLNDKSSGVPLTHTNQVMGTIHYMAPEQWEKPTEVDHRADIYSLGVVFYELLTGELPLGRFAPPSERVKIDVRLDEIVLRTLEKQPERRYQHASDVKTDVEKVAGRLDEVPPVADIPERVKQLRKQERKLERIFHDHEMKVGWEKVRERWKAFPRWQIWLLVAAVAALCLAATASYIEEAFSFLADGGYRTAGIRLPFVVVCATTLLLGTFTWAKLLIDRWLQRPKRPEEPDVASPGLRAVNLLEWFGGGWAVATLLPLTESARATVNAIGLVCTPLIFLASYALGLVWKPKARTWESGPTPPPKGDFFREVWTPLFGILIVSPVLVGLAWEQPGKEYVPAAIGLGVISFLLVGQWLFSRWLMKGVRHALWLKKLPDPDEETPQATSRLRRFAMVLMASIVIATYGIVLFGVFANRIRRDVEAGAEVPTRTENVRERQQQIIGDWDDHDEGDPAGYTSVTFRSDGTVTWVDSRGAVGFTGRNEKTSFEGQYRWINEGSQSEKIEIVAKGRPTRTFKVVFSSNGELTLLEEDGGVTRVKREAGK